ncbi:MAG: substrate-binding domain-containing protein [Abitibacteriaceae bacterium]|nr:substrate-binding domain-containing protein [Abditibacteriaceae bacterium]MBV9863709.1 substrate-binding domain-containing protein [Abditibacteriaceae bacterium]
MPTNLNGRSTKHGELTQKLLDLAQTLEPGGRFPSQAELMRQFQVSDRTVLRSLHDLQRDGWIVRRHGSGTFVADPSERQVEMATTRVATESRTVAALALTFVPSRFYQHCLDLLSAHVEEAGLSLVCHHAPNQASYADALPLAALNPRGFIVFNYALLPIARRLMEQDHRVVMVGVPPAGVHPEIPIIYSNHEQGGYMATRHLLDLGHRRLLYSRIDLSLLPQTLRWRGHLRALREAERAGLHTNNALLEVERLTAWRNDPDLVAAYFRQPDAPTAIVVWNDSEAISLLTILHRAGLRIPEDVSVIGYDALPEGEESLPPLTTVDQHLDTQLHMALDLLAQPVTPSPSQSIVIVPTLVQRASCAAPRSF